MKKKIINLFAIVMLLPLVCLVVYTLYFVCSTQDKESIINNLREYQHIDNVLSDDNIDFKNNLFFVSNHESKEDSKLALYEGKRFLFTDWYRYSDYYGAERSSSNGCGATNITLKDNDEEEHNVAVFFSDGRKNIRKIEYDVTSNMQTETFTKLVKNEPFVFILDNKGQESVNVFSCISGARFYDKNDNLIFDTNQD